MQEGGALLTCVHNHQVPTLLVARKSGRGLSLFSCFKGNFDALSALGVWQHMVTWARRQVRQCTDDVSPLEEV